MSEISQAISACQRAMAMGFVFRNHAEAIEKIEEECFELVQAMKILSMGFPSSENFGLLQRKKSMNKNVKPCPFCGSTDVNIGFDKDRSEGLVACHFGYCNKCSASGPEIPIGGDDVPFTGSDKWHEQSRKSQEEAAAAWNTRAKENV